MVSAVKRRFPPFWKHITFPILFPIPLVMLLPCTKASPSKFIRNLGIPTPDFAVVNSVKEIENVNLPFPLFAKPVAEGTGKGITALSKITNRKNLQKVCKHLLKTFKQPVLVETYLPGREFTVGILGTGKDARALGVLEVILKPDAEKNAYSYENKEHYDILVEYVLVKDNEAQKAMEISLDGLARIGFKRRRAH